MFLSSSNYGYIYIIKDSLGFYKIGRTKNINSRLYTYKTENSSQIELIHTYGAINYLDEEKRLHKLFSDKKLQEKREWFNLSENDIVYIKSLKTENEGILKDIDVVSFGRLEVSKIIDNGFIAYTQGYGSDNITVIDAKGAIILNTYILGKNFNGISIINYSSLFILDKRFNIIESINADQKLKNKMITYKDRFIFTEL